MSQQFGGNTVFYQKAANSTLTLRDVFSDVFKKHNKQDGERLFIAGTSTSTPNESEMLCEWKKPWVFFRVLVVGFGLLLLLKIMTAMGFSQYAYIPDIIIQAAIIPVAVLLFYWEMNIPRNIPIYDVILILLVGGALSMILSGVLISMFMSQHTPAQFYAFVEEPGKLAAACIFLRKPKYRYTLNGVLIGGAVGCGFAVTETIGYYLMNGGHTLIIRGLLSPGGHVLYAALYTGILAGIKGTERLQIKHFLDPNFLMFFGASIGLHYVHNLDFSILPIPYFGDAKFMLTMAIGWFILMVVLKKGIEEVLAIANSSVAYPLTNAAAPSHAPMLYGISGEYAGKSVPLSSGKIVLGRDNTVCNILFPISTAGISRQHCTLTFDGSKVWLCDNHSSNGTFLENGQKLTTGSVIELQVGQRFYLASTITMFELRQ